MLKQIVGQPPGEGTSQSSGDSGLTASRSGAGDPSPSAVSPQARSSRPASSANVLTSDVEIKGSIQFSQDLILDGKVEGEVLSEGQFTVGEHAFIKGEIMTQSVVVFGKVEGNITASERCELKSGSELVGDLSASVAVVEEGAGFKGEAKIGKNPASKTAAAAAPKP